MSREARVIAEDANSPIYPRAFSIINGLLARKLRQKLFVHCSPAVFLRSLRKHPALFVLFVSASFDAAGRRSCKRPSSGTCCIRTSRNPLSSFSLSLSLEFNVLDNVPSEVPRASYLSTYIDDRHGASFAFIDVTTLNRDSRIANESRVSHKYERYEGAKIQKGNNRIKTYI